MAYLHRFDTPRRRKPIDLGMGRFAAIDFETADSGWDSACSLAIVIGQGLEIVETKHVLIRPPRSNIRYTHIHGITWDDVRQCPPFGDLWPTLEGSLAGCDFLAAHSAPFDKTVLTVCCERAGFDPPKLPYQCTVKIARQVWDIFPTKLPNVCERLSIPLQHHNAISDATACARIVIEARRQMSSNSTVASGTSS